jgi:hypothetical protein
LLSQTMTSKICRDCRCTPAAAERGLLVSIWAMRASALWRSSKTIVLYLTWLKLVHTVDGPDHLVEVVG